MASAVGLSPNENVNFLFARTIADDYHGPSVDIALERFDGGVTPAMTVRHGIGVLFGSEHDLLLWLDRARRGALLVERWRFGIGHDAASLAEIPGDAILPLVLTRDSTATPYTHGTSVRAGDDLHVAVASDHADRAREWLRTHGWTDASVEP